MSSNELFFDPVLALAIRAFNKQADQTAKIAELLGPTRTVSCFYDSNSSAKHPRLTGVEFLNVTVTGDIVFNSGAIVGLGAMTATNKNNIVDLTFGSAVLVMSGNGHYVQGTLGLGDDTAFKFSENMFGGAGLAFSPTTSLQSYTYLSTGIGANAPEKTRAMMHSLEYYDWTDPLSPVLIWTNYFTKRIENFSYQDNEMALDNGDSAVWQTPSDSKYGQHLFGATLMLSDPSTTKDGLVVQQQVVIAMAHDNSWSNFPEATAYSRSAHLMSPSPFKILGKDMDGNPLHVWEMHNQEAINAEWLKSANLGQGGRDTVLGLTPKFNILEQLIWISADPRRSNFADKLYSTMRGYRETMSKMQSSMVSVEPLITGGYGGNSTNGLADFWYASKWPLPDQFLTINDINLDDFMNANGSSAYRRGWVEGWGYEPGAYGCHNWYTSPGGPRGDRCPIASILVRYLDNPTGERVQEHASNYDMAVNWSLNHFNHSCHYTPSPSTLQHACTNAQAMSDQWAMISTYYGAYTRPLQIRINGDQRDGEGPWNYDMNGNMAMNGYADDPLHDYGTRGVPAMVFRLPILGLMTKFDFFKSLMLQQNPFGDNSGTFMVRAMAWQWLQITAMWKNASSHPLGVTKKEVEDFFAKRLESLYLNTLKPAFVDMSMDGRMICIRNLGLNASSANGGWVEGGGRLGLYIGDVLKMMRQTGLWHAMRNYSPNCEQALLLTMKTADNFVFGNLAQAQGQGDVYFGVGKNNDITTIPASWADWYAQRQASPDANGHVDDGDFIHSSGYDTNGNWYSRAFSANKDVSWNQFIGYVFTRQYYFPEIDHPLKATAYSEAVRYEQAITDVLAGMSPTNYDALRRTDCVYRYPGVSPSNGPRTPELLGPY